MSTKKIETARILIRKRYRKDMGDIASLAKSIAAIGLINPIVISRERKLLAGHRRLLAVKKLRWKTVEARIMEEPNRKGGRRNGN